MHSEALVVKYSSLLSSCLNSKEEFVMLLHHFLSRLDKINPSMSHTYCTNILLGFHEVETGHDFLYVNLDNGVMFEF